MNSKFRVVLMCLLAVSSAERLRRQFPNNNQLQPYNLPGSFRRPYNPALAHTNGHEQEPANYDFRYDVDVPEYGTNFGHQETSQGDVKRGQYYVLLPDGRTQIVQYTADQDGYHPIISYQGGGGGNGYIHGGSGGGAYGQRRALQRGFRGIGHY